MDFGTPARLAGLLALALVAGCGGSAESRDTDLERSEREKRAKAASGEASGGGGLPGPPSSTPAPRSGDPQVRQVEDRLFATDGGRVVLKAVRAQGGWENWRAIGRLNAVIRPPSPAELASTVGLPPGARTVSLSNPATSFSAKAPLESRLLAGPFYFAHPELKLEYLGVELDAQTGDAYDKVRVYGEDAGTPWSIAYFVRRNAFFARLVEPSQKEGPGTAFERYDLSDPNEFAGLKLATRWTRYALPDRYAHANLKKPDEVEVLQIEATGNPPQVR